MPRRRKKKGDFRWCGATYYICVLMLLICVLVLLYMCPHAPMYVSSCSYVCVLMLLCMCPHAAVYVFFFLTAYRGWEMGQDS
jgi:hypothetical protein